VVRQLEFALGSDISKKRFRKLQQDSAAVTGFSIGCNSTPMGEAGQTLQCGFNQPMAFLTVHMRQKGEAATVSEVRYRIM
jgi:hypothetical protein